MQTDFTSIARTGRAMALGELRRRHTIQQPLNGHGLLPYVSPSQVDTMFHTCRADSRASACFA